MNRREHLRNQWARLVTQCMAIWLGMFILLTVFTVETTWAAGVAGFISVMLFAMMTYLNKDNFLTDEQVLLIIDSPKVV